MKIEDAERYASLALRVTRRGAELAHTGYRKPMTIQHKGAIDLVTNFDTETEALIRAELEHATPDIPIVAEEMGGTESGDRVWYVDPIDGTINYAHGHPFWCVSIGLVVDGMPVAGAVVAPSLQSEWVGWLGGRALRNAEACTVSETERLADAFLATGFPYDRQTSPDNNIVSFAKMMKCALGVRRCGSAALDLCLVADGTFDGYWEHKLHSWDIAAGCAIACAAGARITALDGSPLEVRDGAVIASNGRIHTELVDAICTARARHSLL